MQQKSNSYEFEIYLIKSKGHMNQHKFPYNDAFLFNLREKWIDYT